MAGDEIVSPREHEDVLRRLGRVEASHAEIMSTQSRIEEKVDALAKLNEQALNANTRDITDLARTHSTDIQAIHERVSRHEQERKEDVVKMEKAITDTKACIDRVSKKVDKAFLKVLVGGFVLIVLPVLGYLGSQIFEHIFKRAP